jgi:hypothetical protein
VASEVRGKLGDVRLCSLISEDELSGHLQTLYVVIGNFSKLDVLQYDRQVAFSGSHMVPELIPSTENTFA